MNLIDLMPEIFRQEARLIPEVAKVLGPQDASEDLEVLYARGLALATMSLRFIYNIGMYRGEHPQRVDDAVHAMLQYLHNQVCGMGFK